MKWSRNCLFVLASYAMAFSQQTGIDGDFFTDYASPFLTDDPGNCRAVAMGRAFSALSDDPAALVCNPAGLALFKHKSVSLSVMTDFGTMALSPTNTILSTKSINGKIGTGAGFNYMGFCFPFCANDYEIVAAVAVHTVYGLPEKTSTDVYDKFFKIHEIDKREGEGGVYALSAGAGMEAFKNVFLGACFNFITGSQIRKNIHETKGSGADNLTWQRWQNDFSGVSFDAGLIWKISQVISLGTKATFPNKIYFNDLKSETEKGEKNFYDVSACMFKPFSVATGFSLRFTSDFISTFDVVSGPWKKIQLVTDHFCIDRVYTTSNSFHMGFEYLFHAGAAVFPLRFGFFTMPEQIFEYNSKKAGYKGDQVSSHFLTGGCGFQSSFLSAQLAVEYKFLQYQHLLMRDDLYPVDYRLSRYNIILGIDIIL